MRDPYLWHAKIDVQVGYAVGWLRRGGSGESLLDLSKEIINRIIPLGEFKHQESLIPTLPSFFAHLLVFALWLSEPTDSCFPLQKTEPLESSGWTMDCEESEGPSVGRAHPGQPLTTFQPTARRRAGVPLSDRPTSPERQEHPTAGKKAPCENPCFGSKRPRHRPREPKKPSVVLH